MSNPLPTATVIPNSLSVRVALKNAAHKIDGSKWAFMQLFLAEILLALCLGIVAGYDHIHSGTKLAMGLETGRMFYNWLLTILYCYLGIRRARGQSISINDIRNVLQPKIILNSLGYTIFWCIICFITILFVIAKPFSSLLIGTALLFFNVRLLLTSFFIIDKQMNLFDAIEASFNATQNHFWKLLGSIFLTILFVLVGIITLGVGMVWIIPLVYIFWGEIYVQLSAAFSKPMKKVEADFHLG